jgi:hypothetical protein
MARPTTFSGTQSVLMAEKYSSDDFGLHILVDLEERTATAMSSQL